MTDRPDKAPPALGEERYRTLLQSIDVGFCIIRVVFDDADAPVDYVFLEVNPAFLAQTGLADVLGRNMRALRPDHEDHWFELYGRVARSGEPAHFEHEAAALGRWYNVHAFRVGAPEAEEVAVLFEDITARRIIEQRLRDSEARYRAFVTASADVVYRMSPDWSQMRQLDGGGFVVDTPEPSEKWMERYILPQDRKAVQLAIGRAIRTKGNFELEHRVIRADGTPGWTRSRAIPILDARGDIVEWLGTARDVTLAKTAKDALREGEERYRRLFESMDEAYAVVEVLKDTDGRWTDFRFLEVNPAFMVHTDMPYPVGKTATELLGTPNPRWTQLYGQVLDTGTPMRIQESESRLGRTFDLNIFGLDRARNRVAILFTNITGRKHAEERQKVLLGELQHRVRNTLGVVRSIARRTALNSGSTEELSAHLDGRIEAFARVQAVVTRNPTGGIDLVGLIEDELVAHAVREGETVTLDGPEVTLAVRPAETFSLAIHELVTNAVKYGALFAEGGRIAIRWTLADGRLDLVWRESGVPGPGGAPEREGFGFELLSRVVPYELGARTKVEFAPGGLVFTLSMPAEGNLLTA